MSAGTKKASDSDTFKKLDRPTPQPDRRSQSAYCSLCNQKRMALAPKSEWAKKKTSDSEVFKLRLNGHPTPDRRVNLPAPPISPPSLPHFPTFASSISNTRIMIMRISVAFVFAFCLLFTSCKNDGSSSTAEDADTASHIQNANDPSYAVKKAMEALGSDGNASPPVDHLKLKDMLSEEIHGFERAEYSSQTASAFGINISIAEANYVSSDKSIKLNIADTGGAGMAVMSMAAWSSLDLNKESQDGFERTSTYKGNMSYEKFTKSNNSSELAIIISKRFVVSLDGTKCDVNDLKKFVDDLDVEQLKKMI